MYLAVIMDWHSRCVLSWRLSNTLEADFCADALEGALSMGVPGIFNTDQGSQFTSEAFTLVLLNRGVQISRDSAGAYVGNVFVERLWRSEKQEEARGGVPKGMRECVRGQSRDWSLPELLQKRAASSGFGAPNSGPGVRGRTKPDPPYRGDCHLEAGAGLTMEWSAIL